VLAITKAPHALIAKPRNETIYRSSLSNPLDRRHLSTSVAGKVGCTLKIRPPLGLAISLLVGGLLAAESPSAAAPFKIFMIASTAPDHLEMTAAARTALNQMGPANGFSVDFTTDPTLINDANLANYQVFLQMHLAPFEINLDQRGPLERFVQSGKGWVGVHGAGLIIPSSYVKRNYPNWDFYSTLLGGIVWVTHPALQNGTVIIEDRTQPMTKNLPAMFAIRDEWYEWDSNPRTHVHVLGDADEKTYQQVKPQGDHPMIWTCPAFQRAIYIGIGHDASDWNNNDFSTLIRDSLLWAASGTVTAPSPDAGVDGSSADVGRADSAGGDAPNGGDGAVDSASADGGGLDNQATGGSGGAGAGGSGAGSGGTIGSGGTAGGAGMPGGGNHSGSSGCSYGGGGGGVSAGGGLFLVTLIARRRRSRQRRPGA
jgi:type 1 glutamine amidotransferase